MKNFLNPDNPVMNTISQIVNCVWLNILWFIFCIPIFTVGASTTALFYVTLKMADNEDGNITAQFISAFRSNFRFSTKVWLILMAVIAVFSVDGYVLWHIRYTNVFWTILTAVFFVACAALAVILMYIFPLMARFENTVAAMFRNSLLIGIRYLVCTVLMAGIYFLMTLVVVRFFTPAVIFGEGLCAYLCSLLLSRILHLLEGSEAVSEETSEEIADSIEDIRTGSSEEEKIERIEADEDNGL